MAFALNYTKPQKTVNTYKTINGMTPVQEEQIPQDARINRKLSIHRLFDITRERKKMCIKYLKIYGLNFLS